MTDIDIKGGREGGRKEGGREGGSVYQNFVSQKVQLPYNYGAA